MKKRMLRILACAGTVGMLSAAFAVPAMADTTEENQNIDTTATQQTEVADQESFDWSDKAAANVNTYANIRSGSDISAERVGKLPAGAVATVVGEENGWIQIVSGEVEGYIRGDLLVSGEAAQQLFASVYGDVEIVGAEPVDQAAEEAAAQAAAQQAAQAASAQTGVSVSQSDLDLMAAIIECEAGGEPYEGKIGVGAVIMNRIRSSQFPNTLSEVIYQSGQFSPVASGKLSSVLSRGASQACYDAARDVFAGANTIGDRLFFHAGGGNGLTIANQTFY
ncbi:MAG TPA: cell wall hydrolase [Candidatus Blautia pullicola]|uniref:Cell wall hydrolase n=1 Tax=Candidatus Blautia pullicola TaxID=2838498 RepID=A0A9D2FSD5_9FIRM|nr:cell wall hydrolase [Candidatus Blautia pullicola]